MFGFRGRVFGGAFCAAILLFGPMVSWAGAATPDGGASAVPIERSAEGWNDLCDAAVGEDAERAAQAVATLRAAGMHGWKKFVSRHADAVARLAEKPACLCEAGSRDGRIAAALDKIAAQRDAASSGLYWHTDTAAAVAAAKQDGRPILSLRMLGRLDDDLSCANSRFFRTTLYADAELARYLGETFILHWESVRPVPVITIEFGDGRTMRRTITGNSAHYVLDPNGRVIDCLPGLYSPAEFRRHLQLAEATARTTYVLGQDAGRPIELANYHRRSMLEIDRAVREVRRATSDEPALTANTNVPIANGSPPAPSKPLPDSLGESLLAPRTLPEPFSAWAAPYWTLGSTDEQAAKLDLTAAARTRTIKPGRRAPPVEQRPDAVEATETVVSKSRVERAVVNEIVFRPPLVRVEGNQIVVNEPEPTEESNDPQAAQEARASDLLDPLAAAMPKLPPQVVVRSPAVLPPSAGRASTITRSKGLLELPLIAAMDERDVPAQPAEDAVATGDALEQLANRIRGETRLGPGSVKLIRAKFDSTPAVADEKPSFETLREVLETSIAADTARNEYDLHRKIHAWLAADPNLGVDDLNERVYSELFLTPRSDPWLGLAPADAFPALDHGGLFVEP